MKIKLVFDDWKKDNKSIYSTEEGVDLSMGNFHPGTTFNGEIDLDEWDEKELTEVLKGKCVPHFYVVQDDEQSIKEKPYKRKQYKHNPYSNDSYIDLEHDIEVIRKATEEICKTPESARAYLVKHGFLTKEGKLTERYGGEKE